MKVPPFKRILSDKHDKLVFGLAFVVGIIVILLIRITGDFVFKDRSFLWEALAIIFAVGVIFIYTIYIALTKNRSGISVDRASDNIYYLGLLFTLTSLAYSLVKLQYFGTGSANSASARLVLNLLPDFGLALFSTIAGIFGRIFLQQMRNDPLEIETAAREELGIAINMLRESINQLVMNVGNLSTQTSITMTELNQTVSKTLEETASQNAIVIQNAAEEIGTLSTQLQKQMSEMAEFSKEFTTQFNEIYSQFETAGELPRVMEEKVTDLEKKLSVTVNQIEEVSSMLGEYSENIDASVRSVDEANNEYVGELNKAARVLRAETNKK